MFLLLKSFEPFKCTTATRPIYIANRRNLNSPNNCDQTHACWINHPGPGLGYHLSKRNGIKRDRQRAVACRGEARPTEARAEAGPRATVHDSTRAAAGMPRNLARLGGESRRLLRPPMHAVCTAWRTEGGTATAACSALSLQLQGRGQ